MHIAKMLAALFAFVVFTVAHAATMSVPSNGTSASSASALSSTVEVVEYYNASLDHYFMTADAAEISALDTGTVSGWSRTGYSFRAYPTTAMGSGLNPVCRFYGLPQAGLDSHFYSGSAAECASTVTKFAGQWVLESSNVFEIGMPDVATGLCPSATAPVYRVFNNRRDANHRYTTDKVQRAAMIANGGMAEGYGPDGVAFCAPGPAANSDVATRNSVTILATQVASDTFDFSSSIAMDLPPVAYVWNFGDGSSGAGAAVSHQFNANGDYVVGLDVVDTKGNHIAATKAVTVNAKGSGTTPGAANAGGAASDFDTRKTAPGVVRYFDFDATAQLGDTSGHAQGPYGILAGEKGGPSIDTTTKASGNGSLRFDLVPFVKPGGNQAGEWYANFADDFSVQFTDGQTFYVQWRQRFSQAMVDNVYYAGPFASGSPDAWVPVVDANGKLLPVTFPTLNQVTIPGTTAWQARGAGNAIRFQDATGKFVGYGITTTTTTDATSTTVTFALTQGTTVGAVAVARGETQGGLKMMDVVVGDTATKKYGSCEANEIPITTNGQFRVPIAYNSCGRYLGFYSNNMLQNGVGCDWRPMNNLPPDAAGKLSAPAPCFSWVANEWMTFEIRVKLGAYNATTQQSGGSEYQLWGAREGGDPVLVIDWRPGIPDYFPIYTGGGGDVNLPFGKVVFFPWLTSKDPTQAAPAAQTWYDELIISRQPIAFPGGKALAVSGTSPSPLSVPNFAPVSTKGKLAQLTSGGVVDLGAFKPPVMDGEDPLFSRDMTAYSGMVYDAPRKRVVLNGGGHAASNNDGIATLDIATLQWGSEYTPTPLASMTPDNADLTLGAWKSGPSGPYPRPFARHTKGLLVSVDDELLDMSFVDGNHVGLPGDWSSMPSYVHGPDHLTQTNGRVAHYNYLAKTWRFSPTQVAFGPSSQDCPAAALDPVSGKILVAGTYHFYVYDRTTMTGVDAVAMPQLRDEGGNLVHNGYLPSINQSLVYYPPDDSFYYLGNTGAVVRIIPNRADWSKTQFVLLQTTGTPPPAQGNPQSGTEVDGAAYDSTNQLIGVGPWGGTFYAFDPRTKSWATKTLSAAISLAFHALAYVPEANAYIFITTSGETMAFRWN